MLLHPSRFRLPIQQGQTVIRHKLWEYGDNLIWTMRGVSVEGSNPWRRFKSLDIPAGSLASGRLFPEAGFSVEALDQHIVPQYILVQTPNGSSDMRQVVTADQLIADYVIPKDDPAEA